MNLVKLIQDQLAGETLGKLSSLLGTDPDTTERATSAAVPTILSGLSAMASNESGAKKLANLLGDFSGGDGGSFAQMLGGGDGGSILQKGQGMLASMLGESAIGSVANSIGRFAGLDAGITKKLLGFLLPMVMKVVGGQWQARGGSPASLTNIFAEQKANIASAIPAGFSLPQIPGLSAAKDAVHSASETTRRAAETAGTASRSVGSWAIPLAIAIAAGLLLWNVFSKRQVADKAASSDAKRTTVMRPTLPDVPAISAPTQVTDEMSGIVKSIGDAFAGIKDAASAEAALPKLEALNSKLEAFKTTVSQLPESSRDSLKTAFADRMGVVKEQASKTLDVPGISEKFRTLILQIVRKLEEIGLISKTN